MRVTLGIVCLVALLLAPHPAAAKKRSAHSHAASCRDCAIKIAGFCKRVNGIARLLNAKELLGDGQVSESYRFIRKQQVCIEEPRTAEEQMAFDTALTEFKLAKKKGTLEVVVQSDQTDISPQDLAKMNVASIGALMKFTVAFYHRCERQACGDGFAPPGTTEVLGRKQMKEKQRREKARLKELKKLAKTKKRRAKSAAKELKKEQKRLSKIPRVDTVAAPDGQSWDELPDEEQPDGTEGFEDEGEPGDGDIEEV
jgi:hypothetical protein